MKLGCLMVLEYGKARHRGWWVVGAEGDQGRRRCLEAECDQGGMDER